MRGTLPAHSQRNLLEVNCVSLTKKKNAGSLHSLPTLAENRGIITADSATTRRL